MNSRELKPHSCKYCQKLIIDTRQPEIKDRNVRVFSHRTIRFDFTLNDIRLAATENCAFCNWFLDDEYVDYDSAVASVPGIRGMNEFRTLIPEMRDGAADQALRTMMKSRDRTLRRLLSQLDTSMDHYILVGKYSASPSNIIQIEYFGLWDPVAKEMKYRAGQDFRVFADPKDIASQEVLTRPVEIDPSSGRNLEDVRSWLSQCLTCHEKCHSMDPRKNHPSIPLRLIHVHCVHGTFQLRLTKTEDLEAMPPFLALSYCWGGDQPIKCTKHAITGLMENIPFNILPATIRDAITVCQYLGFCYIWIDALCIMQDDPDEQAVEIAKMPYIYGMASMTIAASRARAATAGFLFPRLKDLQTPLFSLPYRCEDGDLGSIILLGCDETKEPIDERDWTLQERVLSSRLVEFGNFKTRWSCQESKHVQGWRFDDWGRDFNETLLSPGSILSTSGTESEDSGPNRTPVQMWEYILTVYTKRQLGVSTDRPLAISGIAEQFDSVFGGGQYIAGLWKPFLRQGLLWHSHPDDTFPQPSAYQGPSWSWTSVNGSIVHRYQSSQSLWTVEIVSCLADLAYKASPYGSVQPHSARLTVRGFLRPAICTINKISSKNIVKRAKRVLKFYDGDDCNGSCIGVAEMFCDTTEFGEDVDSRIHVIALQMQSLRNELSGNTGAVGLALRPFNVGKPSTMKNENVFKRIGLFEFALGARYREEQRVDESGEDLKRRLIEEPNLFQNIEPQEIIII